MERVERKLNSLSISSKPEVEVVDGTLDRVLQWFFTAEFPDLGYVENFVVGIIPLSGREAFMKKILNLWRTNKNLRSRITDFASAWMEVCFLRSPRCMPLPCAACSAELNLDKFFYSQEFATAEMKTDYVRLLEAQSKRDITEGNKLKLFFYRGHMRSQYSEFVGKQLPSFLNVIPRFRESSDIYYLLWLIFFSFACIIAN
jgi:hypothetical protein